MWYVDTNFWYALVNARDRWHTSAALAHEAREGDTCSSSFVVAEVVSLLMKRAGKHSATTLLRTIEGDPSCEIIHPTPAQYVRARDLFARHPDWDFDLVDAISFIVMQDRGIERALTFDHHFEQMGFTTAPRDSAD